MTGHLSHCCRIDCGWTSREAALHKRTLGSSGAASWGLHHGRMTSRAREGTLVLHSALMGSHVRHSVLLWEPPVTANTVRNWRGCRGERLWWAEGWSVGCCEEWLGALSLFSLEKRREGGDCCHQQPKRSHQDESEALLRDTLRGVKDNNCKSQGKKLWLNMRKWFQSERSSALEQICPAVKSFFMEMVSALLEKSLILHKWIIPGCSAGQAGAQSL